MAETTTDVEERTPSPRGLEDLYVRNAPAALRLAYFLTGDRGSAEDLVQEAFVRVAGKFSHVREPDTLPAYLRRTIVNLHTSHLRRRRLEREWARRQQAQPTVMLAYDPGERDELWRAMTLLTPRQRAAVVLRYYEDLPERQAAEVLGCSVGALNQLVVRALDALRDRVGKDAG
jgi:RNA polymerase sigma-70 factor (sigma-E family)